MSYIVGAVLGSNYQMQYVQQLNSNGSISLGKSRKTALRLDYWEEAYQAIAILTGPEWVWVKRVFVEVEE